MKGGNSPSEWERWYEKQAQPNHESPMKRFRMTSTIHHDGKQEIRYIPETRKSPNPIYRQQGVHWTRKVGKKLRDVLKRSPRKRDIRTYSKKGWF